jgi:hypothetical protein
MAARIRRTHQDEIRAKIKVSNLLTRLTKYAEGELSDDDISPNRLNAIKLLLSKTLPDLSSIQLTGDADNPVAVTSIERSIIDVKNAKD